MSFVRGLALLTRVLRCFTQLAQRESKSGGSLYEVLFLSLSLIFFIGSAQQALQFAGNATILVSNRFLLCLQWRTSGAAEGDGGSVDLLEPLLAELVTMVRVVQTLTTVVQNVHGAGKNVWCTRENARETNSFGAV